MSPDASDRQEAIISLVSSAGFFFLNPFLRHIDDGKGVNDFAVTEDEKELWFGKVIYFRILVLLKIQALESVG